MKFLDRKPFGNLYLLFSLFLTLLSGVFHISSATTPSQKTGTIKGIITDTNGELLAGVNVALPQLNRGTISKEDGTFLIREVPTGSYTVVFSFVGFSKVNRKVTVREGQPVELKVTLKRQTLESETITVTGTPYASDPLTTPTNVDVLAGNAKLATQQTSLGGSIDQLAGVTTIQTGSQSGKPVIRGLSGNRVRVLDDGTPMEYQQYGVRHAPNVDPFTAERIEVVRGASSVQYGSDAIGGAINVISGSIPQALDRDNFVRGQTLAEFSSNNNEVAGGLHLEGASGGFGWTGSLIRRSGGNITAPDVPTFQETNDTSAPKFSGELSNTDFDQVNGSFGLGYSAQNWELSTEFTHWQNAHNFLLPNGKGLGQFLQNDVLTLEGTYKPGNNWIFTPEVTYTRNLRQSSPGGASAVSREDLSDENLAVDVLRKTLNSRLEIQHPAFGLFSGQIGLEYKHDDQSTFGPEPLVPAGNVNNVSAFVYENAEIEALTLSVGLRIDHRTQQVTPNVDLNLPDYENSETEEVLDQTYTEFSGSLGANFQLTEHLALSANIGRGFRAPSLFNLHVDGVHGGIAAYQIGDPYLEPERSLNTDFSVRWRSENLKAKATAYRNQIINYMFLVNTGKFAGNGSGPPILRSTQNNAVLVGGDASLQAQILSWLQVSSTFEIVNGKNSDTGDSLPLLPPSRVGGNLRFMQSELGPLENAFFKIGIDHTFAKDAAGRFEPFWQFGNSPAFSDFGVASTDAYTLLNAGFGFELPLWNRPVSFQVTANNLLNEAYRDFLDTYKGYALSPGRNIEFKLMVPFTIQ